MGWLKSHWKSLVVIAAATVVFVAVTALTGGLGAPAMLALASGGFASGAAGYVTQQLLDGQPVTATGALKAAAISTVVTVATAGLGRVVAPALGRVLPRGAVAIAAARPTATAVVVGSAVGGPIGAGVKVVENVATGQPALKDVGDAYVLGTVNGAIAGPVARVVHTPATNLGRTIAGRTGPTTRAPVPGELATDELPAPRTGTPAENTPTTTAPTTTTPTTTPPAGTQTTAQTTRPAPTETVAQGGEANGPSQGRGIRGALLQEEPTLVATKVEPTKGQRPLGPDHPEARRSTGQTEKPPAEEPPARPGPESYESWKKGIPEAVGKDPVADVAYFTKDVPSFATDVAALRAKGWDIRYGEPGKGSWANSEGKPPTIVIDPKGSQLEILKTLAHEVGHANERPTPVRDAMTMSRDEYVATRVHDMALSEGQAVYNEALVLEAFRKSVRERTGTSPELPYQGQYRTIAQNKNLSVDARIEQIGKRYMENETPSLFDPSDASAPNYNGYWSDLFGREWDAARGAATPH